MEYRVVYESPGVAPGQVPPTWGDYGIAMLGTLAEAAAGAASIGEGLTGLSLGSERIGEAAKRLYEGLTPGAVRELGRPVFSLGEEAAWRHPQSIGINLARMAPATIGGAVPALAVRGLAARAALAGRPGLATAITSGAYGLGEGAISAALTQQSIVDELKSLSDEELTTRFPEIRDALASGVPRDEIIRGIAARAVPYALGAGAATGAISGLGGAAVFGDAARRGFLSRIKRGAAVEALTEAPQSAQEQVLANLAVGAPWERDVAEATAAGAFYGGILGGALGALSRRIVPPDIRAAAQTIGQPASQGLQPGTVAAAATEAAMGGPSVAGGAPPTPEAPAPPPPSQAATSLVGGAIDQIVGQPAPSPPPRTTTPPVGGAVEQVVGQPPYAALAPMDVLEYIRVATMSGGVPIEDLQNALLAAYHNPALTLDEWRTIATSLFPGEYTPEQVDLQYALRNDPVKGPKVASALRDAMAELATLWRLMPPDRRQQTRDNPQGWEIGQRFLFEQTTPPSVAPTGVPTARPAPRGPVAPAPSAPPSAVPSVTPTEAPAAPPSPPPSSERAPSTLVPDDRKPAAASAPAPVIRVKIERPLDAEPYWVVPPPFAASSFPPAASPRPPSRPSFADLVEAARLARQIDRNRAATEDLFVRAKLAEPGDIVGPTSPSRELLERAESPAARAYAARVANALINGSEDPTDVMVEFARSDVVDPYSWDLLLERFFFDTDLHGRGTTVLERLRSGTEADVAAARETISDAVEDKRAEIARLSDRIRSQLAGLAAAGDVDGVAELLHAASRRAPVAGPKVPATMSDLAKQVVAGTVFPTSAKPEPTPVLQIVRNLAKQFVDAVIEPWASQPLPEPVEGNIDPLARDIGEVFALSVSRIEEKLGIPKEQRLPLETAMDLGLRVAQGLRSYRRVTPEILARVLVQRANRMDLPEHVTNMIEEVHRVARPSSSADYYRPSQAVIDAARSTPVEVARAFISPRGTMLLRTGPESIATVDEDGNTVYVHDTSWQPVPMVLWAMAYRFDFSRPDRTVSKIAVENIVKWGLSRPFGSALLSGFASWLDSKTGEISVGELREKIFELANSGTKRGRGAVEPGSGMSALATQIVTDLTNLINKKTEGYDTIVRKIRVAADLFYKAKEIDDPRAATAAVAIYYEIANNLELVGIAGALRRLLTARNPAAVDIILDALEKELKLLAPMVRATLAELSPDSGAAEVGGVGEPGSAYGPIRARRLDVPVPGSVRAKVVTRPRFGRAGAPLVRYNVSKSVAERLGLTKLVEELGPAKPLPPLPPNPTIADQLKRTGKLVPHKTDTVDVLVTKLLYALSIPPRLSDRAAHAQRLVLAIWRHPDTTPDLWNAVVQMTGGMFFPPAITDRHLVDRTSDVPPPAVSYHLSNMRSFLVSLGEPSIYESVRDFIERLDLDQLSTSDRELILDDEAFEAGLVERENRWNEFIESLQAPIESAVQKLVFLPLQKAELDERMSAAIEAGNDEAVTALKDELEQLLEQERELEKEVSQASKTSARPRLSVSERSFSDIADRWARKPLKPARPTLADRIAEVKAATKERKPRKKKAPVDEGREPKGAKWASDQWSDAAAAELAPGRTDGTRLVGALLSDLPPGSVLHRVAMALGRAPLDVAVEVVPSDDPILAGRPAVYLPRDDRILVSTDAQGDPVVLLHELIHAATARGLRADAKVANLVERVRLGLEQVGAEDAIADRLAYAASSTDELLSMGLTDPVVNEVLRATPDPDAPTSLWGTLKRAIVSAIDAFRRAVGRNPVTPPRRSALDALLEVLPRLHELHNAGMSIEAATRLPEVLGSFLPSLGAASKEAIMDVVPWFRRIALASKFLVYIEQQLSKVPQLSAAAQRLTSLLAARNELVNTELRAANIDVRQWFSKVADLPDGSRQLEVLGRLWHDGTMAEVYPDRPETDPDNVAAFDRIPWARSIWRSLAAEYASLLPEAKTLYHNVLQMFANDRERRALLLAERYIKHTELSIQARDVQDAADRQRLLETGVISDLDERFFTEVFEAGRTPGPYVPLRRFGNYAIQARTPEEAGMLDDAALQRMFDEYGWALHIEYREPRNPKNPDAPRYTRWRLWVYDQAETLGEAKALAAKLEKSTTPSGKPFGWTVELDRITGRVDRVASMSTLTFAELKRRADPFRRVRKLRAMLKTPGLTPEREARIKSLIAQATKKAEAAAPAYHSMVQAFIEMTPEGSHLKRSLPRRKIAGATKDFIRVVSSHMQEHARALAQLHYGDDIAQTILELDENARQIEDVDQRVAVQQVIEELKIREQGTLEPAKAPRFRRTISNLTFGAYLLSVSTIFVNLLQPITTTAPVLWSRFPIEDVVDTMGRVYKAIARPMLEHVRTNVLPEMLGSLRRLRGPAPTTFMLYNVLDPLARQVTSDPAMRLELATLLSHLDQLGKLSLSMTIDMDDVAADLDPVRAMIGQSAATKTAAVLRQGWVKAEALFDWTKIGAHYAEMTNRVAAALSGYLLARKAGQSIEEATLFAQRLVDTTQIDYSSVGRPRLLDTRQRPWLTMAVALKTYVFGMYALLMSNLYKALTARGAERVEALKVVIGVSATHAVLGGLVGGLFEPVAILVGLLTAAAGEDDDWPIVARRELTKLVGPGLAEAVVHGPLRALGGPDLSNRVSIGRLLLGDLGFFSGDPEKLLFDLALGPFASMARTIYEVPDRLARGDTVGAAMAIPLRPVRDLLRAYDLAHGVTDRSGGRLLPTETVDAYEVLMRAIGFEPGELAEARLLRYTLQRRERRIMEERSRVLERWYRSGAYGMTPDILRFNARYPQAQITFDTLVRSRRARDALEKRIFGVRVPVRTEFETPTWLDPWR